MAQIGKYLAQIGKHLAQNGLKMHKICICFTLLTNMWILQLSLGHFSIACIPGTTCHSLGWPNFCLEGPNMAIFGMEMLNMPVFHLYGQYLHILSNSSVISHGRHIGALLFTIGDNQIFGIKWSNNAYLGSDMEQTPLSPLPTNYG